VSLNQAVVKLAQEHASISPHQVLRVVEYANQETFQRLFDDNEKYACDKNIEFDLADPRVVLHELNDGARPHVMTPPPDDYSQAPVKLAHSTVEADVELCRAFGMEPVSPGMEKVATLVVDGRVLSTNSRDISRWRERGLLPEGSITNDDIVRAYGMEKEAKAGPLPFSGGAVDRILGVEKEAGVGWAAGWRGLKGLGKLVGQGKFRQAGQAAGTVAKRFAAAPGATALMGAGLGAGVGAASAGPDRRLRGALLGGTLGAVGGTAAGLGRSGWNTLNTMGTPVGATLKNVAPSAAGALGATGAALGGGVLLQKNSMRKEAMDYAKTGRPAAELVLDDMRSATSVDRIKEATAEKDPYPEANPYGELLRARQQLEKGAQDSRDAAAKNRYLYDEAMAKVAYEVRQHLLRGGNFGEVIHSMGSVTPPDAVKVAMKVVLPDLMAHGFDPVKAQAEAVEYEMVKGASARAPNPKNPLIQAYASAVKLAEGQAMLDATHEKFASMLKEVEDTVKEAGIASRAVGLAARLGAKAVGGAGKAAWRHKGGLATTGVITLPAAYQAKGAIGRGNIGMSPAWRKAQNTGMVTGRVPT
jgi:hypothetical protein